MLYAHQIPNPSPKGDGETEFADLRAAYDALPDAMKEMIEPLVAEHSIFHSRALIGFTEFTDEERAAMPPVRAAPRAPLSRLRAQDAVPGLARLAYRRLAGA